MAARLSMYLDRPCKEPDCTHKARRGRGGRCRRCYQTRQRVHMAPAEYRARRAGHCENDACGERGLLQLDHDHICCDNPGGPGQVCGRCTRGFLCHRCNVVLGRLENGYRVTLGPRLDGLVRYLDRYWERTTAA